MTTRGVRVAARALEASRATANEDSDRKSGSTLTAPETSPRIGGLNALSNCVRFGYADVPTSATHVVKACSVLQ
jgi:hypothetical protein